MPDQLDLRAYKGTGIGSGEVPMPEDAGNSNGGSSGGGGGGSVLPDEELVGQLVSMGFSENGCRRAAVATRNADPEAAMNWILEHMDDADFNDPLPNPTPGGASATDAATAAGPGSAEVQGMVEMISSMGYTSDQATAALKATDYDIERYPSPIFGSVFLQSC